MTADDQTSTVRRALGVLGDAAMPPASFEQLALRDHTRFNEPRPRRTTLSVVLVVACVLAVWVVMVMNRSGRDAVGSKVGALSTGREFAVPLRVPDGMRLSEVGTSDFTGAFDADPSRHGVDAVVSYSSPSGNLTVATGRAIPLRALEGSRRLTLPDGVSVEVAGDLEVTRMRWVQPDGPVVLIVANNIALDQLLEIAASMWFVTADQWNQLSAHAGFRSAADAARGWDAWRVPGGGEGEVFVSGSLQSGLRVSFGRGSTLLVAPTPAQDCRAETLDQRTFLLLGPFDTKAFNVIEADGTVTRVDAASPPGLPAWRMASFQTSQQYPTLDIRCGGAGS